MSSDDAAIKPRLRPEAARNILRVLATLNEVMGTEQDIPMFQNCVTCAHFNEETEICRAYTARPPARVIAYGCRTYKDQLDIPF